MKLRGPLLALLLLAGSARAHTGGVSESELTVQDDGVVHGRIAIPAQELAALAPIDHDGDGKITQAEVDGQHEHFERLASGLLDLSADGQPCTASLAKLVVGDQNDGVDMFIDYRCNIHPHRVEVQALLLSALPLSHRHAMLLRAGDRTERAALAGPQRHATITTPFEKRDDKTTAWWVLGALASLLVYVVSRKRLRR
jgi:hypothetical protein